MITVYIPSFFCAKQKITGPRISSSPPSHQHHLCDDRSQAAKDFADSLEKEVEKVKPVRCPADDSLSDPFLVNLGQFRGFYLFEAT